MAEDVSGCFLNQFGFSNGAQDHGKRIRWSTGSLNGRNYGPDDVAVVAFGRVAGVSSLSNSDTKFYIRGLSSFKESRDEAPAADELASPEIRQNFQETAFFFPSF